MKRTILFLILLGSSVVVAQSLKLSQTFSRSAIAALHAINATGWALPSSVQELEMRQADAQSAMDDAKDAAESQDDADAFVYLQRYQLRHSQNFADYTNAITGTAGRMSGKNTLQRAAAIVAKDPKFIARKRKEMACSAALEKKLRALVFSRPAACDLY
ncbi:MAG: hypothetical protein ACM3SW_10525 [Actinomycetota bacterium]